MSDQPKGKKPQQQDEDDDLQDLRRREADSDDESETVHNAAEVCTMVTVVHILVTVFFGVVLIGSGLCSGKFCFADRTRQVHLRRPSKVFREQRITS